MSLVKIKKDNLISELQFGSKQKEFCLMQTKNNISKVVAFWAIAFLFFSFTSQSNLLNTKDWRKIEKKAKTTYHLSSVNFSELTINNSNGKGSFFKIEEVGYLAIGQAPSKFHQFEYFILFSNKGDILYVEVLNYRENYGAEICNKRWLQQFKNINTTSIFEFNSSVDGISGATLSVQSIRFNIWKVTQELHTLIKQK